MEEKIEPWQAAQQQADEDEAAVPLETYVVTTALDESTSTGR
jgi:hypothetical protein